MNERDEWKKTSLDKRLRSFEYLASDHICIEAAEHIALLEGLLQDAINIIVASKPTAEQQMHVVFRIRKALKTLNNENTNYMQQMKTIINSLENVEQQKQKQKQIQAYKIEALQDKIEAQAEIITLQKLIINSSKL